MEEVQAQCKSCGGTGLYVGFAERDGAAVVCHTCKGTGCQTIKYERFVMRRQHTHRIERVFETNPGIGIDGGADFGGMPLKEWESGFPFPPGSENRRFTCPSWWYQSANYNKKPRWDKCRTLGRFSECAHFSNKAECWRQWDRENKGA